MASYGGRNGRGYSHYKANYKRRIRYDRVAMVVIFFVLFIALVVYCVYSMGSDGDPNIETAADVCETSETTAVTSVTTVTTTTVTTTTTKPEPEHNCVYLTFDDGPSYLTPDILDILDRYDVKATFFVTALNPDCFDYIKEAHDRGHTIGLHTYCHKYSELYASEEAYFEDLDKIGKVCEEKIGFRPKYIRFPGGSSNTVSADYCEGLMSKLVDKVHEKGYEYYDWDVSSGDASGNNVDTYTLISQSEGGEGFDNVMILFHDARAKDTTVEALPSVIEFYQQRGYTIKGISDGTEPIHHKVNN